MYQLLDDYRGANEYYCWFDKTYEDDSGEPYMRLCWTLALRRSGEEEAASMKFQATMCGNLYLIPYLLGDKIEDLNIWTGCNWEWREYAEDIPRELLRLWSKEDKEWVRSLYHGTNLSGVRTRYIEINRQLKDLKPGAERTALVMESHRLKYSKDLDRPELKLV